ncbi:adaptor protein MecA [Loigolactobacillus backii]|uniref:Adapter protein MecA n=1 Tax=Loigolactobacillus backii TaxID=375175 RepID=A0A192H5A5_9LACO|nr:adaptor protein MecA [Loigolactobacillus backii]ANK60075.1 adaptor protein MecA [Loigolactobacillus backii]ANK63423.1 adaptor protein MecA [Loigolactobacillus backii]ANK64958.1 adaptor protein MecA [Loigolactobacillus backii]ANK66541.1 adaptor protein MecA [Loigolactobacillus backii]ANK69572.1 adaptor protein MecA [Loigolactobacillus backii]
MEMERINENTIRVLLKNEDLTERGITVLDLLGNHKQIENFFYSILEEVDTDHQFQSNDAVTFQVLPNKNGLELFISKNAPASGTPINDLSDTDHEAVSDILKKQLLARDDNAQQESTAADSDDEYGTYLNDPDTPTKEIVLKLHDFEDMVQLAKILHLDGAVSNLYRYKDSFYLHLIFFVDETSESSVKDEIAIAMEYADRTTVTPDVLSEYGKRIMEKSALELTRYYFK